MPFEKSSLLEKSQFQNQVRQSRFVSYFSFMNAYFKPISSRMTQFDRRKKIKMLINAETTSVENISRRTGRPMRTFSEKNH